MEEARIGGATEYQQAARFQQQRGGWPGRGPGLRGGLKVSASPKVRGLARLADLKGWGGAVSEFPGTKAQGRSVGSQGEALEWKSYETRLVGSSEGQGPASSPWGSGGGGGSWLQLGPRDQQA